MSKYREKDAARDTGTSIKSVKRNWHQARNDAASDGSLSERNVHKANDSGILDKIVSFFSGNKDGTDF